MLLDCETLAILPLFSLLLQLKMSDDDIPTVGEDVFELNTPTVHSPLCQQQSLLDNPDDELDNDDNSNSNIERYPSYLINNTESNDETIHRFVDEEAKEEGDGGDSDEEGEDAEVHDAALEEVLLQRTAEVVAGEDDDQLVDDNDKTAVMLHRGAITSVEARCLELPGPPKDWVPPPTKIAFGKPGFEYVDNPGEWSEFTYRPEFSKNTYVKHTLPTGCTVHPLHNLIQRQYICGDWEFFYNGWKGDPNDIFRTGATSDNLFPEVRQGYLDATILRKLGLTKKKNNRS